MAEEQQQEKIVIDDKEFLVSDLEPNQRYMYDQIMDLRSKQFQAQFQLDQVNVALSSFQNLLQKSLTEEKVEEPQTTPEAE
jgi:hypothetical protein